MPAAVKKERLNRLLARQEAIGFARNRERIGSVASVLVDTLEHERAHDHDDGRRTSRRPRRWPAATRSRRPWPTAGFASPAARARTGWSTWPGRAALVGSIVDVRIEAAGPYSLRGVLA